VSLKVGIGASQSNENDDDDMQMTQAHVSIKCPFTQVRFGLICQRCGGKTFAWNDSPLTLVSVRHD